MVAIWLLLGMAEFEDLGIEILLGDLAGSSPATLVIDCIDPDGLAGVIAGFIPVGLVDDSETLPLVVSAFVKRF
jgi:hypothetical protein